jgi:hypothetical protein
VSLDFSDSAQVSRRSLLRAGVWSAIGLAGLQALACTPTQPATTAAPAPGGATGGDKAPKSGGMFNVSMLREFDTIDPHNQYNIHGSCSANVIHKVGIVARPLFANIAADGF